MKHPIIQRGYYLWVPPPCAVDVAIEQLRLAQTKRKQSTHLIVIPRLMCPRWTKALFKIADLVFTIDPVNTFWSKDMHNQLFFAFVFPFLTHRPWQLRSTPEMIRVGRELCALYKTADMASGNFLQAFLLEVKRFSKIAVKAAILRKTTSIST